VKVLLEIHSSSSTKARSDLSLSVIIHVVARRWQLSESSWLLLLVVQVKVTQRLQGYESPQDIRRLKRGDYFGEKALLRSRL